MPVRRAIALIGNTVALTLLGLLLLQHERLWGERSVREPSPATGPARAAAPDTPAPRVSGDAPSDGGASVTPLLVVVIDALRDDTARDAALMPNLALLAEGGRRALWWVDLLLPSTIGALERIVEGEAPPPVAALRDFAARPARHGGWLEEARERGARVVVAGPDLWHERYGAWIDAGRGEAGMPTASSDRRVTASARRALEGRERGSAAAASAALDTSGPGPAGTRVGRAHAPPELVVAHLAELDAVAHRHGAGADVEAWRAAARRVDARLGELLASAPPGRAVVVLADHGTTRRGGHAGGEAVVRRAPLVAARMPHGLPSTRDCDFVDPHRLVRAVLFGSGEDSLVGEPSGHRRLCTTVRAGRESPPLVTVAATALLVVAGFGALATTVSLARDGAPGFLASATLWTAIGAAALARPLLAAALAGTALASLAALGLARRRPAAPAARAARAGRGLASLAPAPLVVVPLLGAAASGAVLACVAIAVAGRGADVSLDGADALPVLAVLVGFAGGVLAARPRSPHAAGIALAVAIACAVHAGGETVSLSSVDVRLAHRVAGSASGVPGVLLALPVALSRLVLPIVAVLAAWLLASRRAACGRDEATRRALDVATSFAACQLGAGALFALSLAWPSEAATLAALPSAASGLGGLLRECVTTCLVFAALVLGGDRVTSSRA